MSTPNNGIDYVPEGTLDPAAGLNLSLNQIDALLQLMVISMVITAPPGSPDDGDRYIVPIGASGAWVGHVGQVARYVEEGASWQFYNAKLALNQDDGGLYRNIGDSSGWQAVTGGGSALTVIGDDSNATTVDPCTSLIFGAGFEVTDEGAGVARVVASGGGGGATVPPVVTESGTNLNASTSNSGNYTRFTNAGAKTYTFDDSAGLIAGAEYHARNVGSGDLTIVGNSGMTLRPPFGGGLKVKQGGTVTMKVVDSDEIDIIGQTST